MRLVGVFEGLPGEFVACLVILLAVMIGRLAVSLCGKIVHLGGDLVLGKRDGDRLLYVARTRVGFGPASRGEERTVGRRTHGREDEVVHLSSSGSSNSSNGRRTITSATVVSSRFGRKRGDGRD